MRWHGEAGMGGVCEGAGGWTTCYDFVFLRSSPFFSSSQSLVCSFPFSITMTPISHHLHPKRKLAQPIYPTPSPLGLRLHPNPSSTPPILLHHPERSHLPADEIA